MKDEPQIIHCSTPKEFEVRECFFGKSQHQGTHVEEKKETNLAPAWAKKFISSLKIGDEKKEELLIAASAENEDDRKTIFRYVLSLLGKNGFHEKFVFSNYMGLIQRFAPHLLGEELNTRTKVNDIILGTKKTTRMMRTTRAQESVDTMKNSGTITIECSYLSLKKFANPRS